MVRHFCDGPPGGRGSKFYFDDISIRNKHKIRVYSKLFCIIQIMCAPHSIP